ncbi:MAG: hypothetical protein AAFQ41_02405 [Cyanobacteria bacterium J06623_7]
METHSVSNSHGYNLFVQHYANNLYHLKIVDPEQQLHQFEGIYPTPQAAIAKGQSVIENFIFWRSQLAKS